MQDAMNNVRRLTKRSLPRPVSCHSTSVLSPERRALLAEQGFRNVGGYIFGGNQKREAISMTAPVRAEPVKP